MVVNFLNHNELTNEDIKDLQAILDKKRKK